MPDENCNVCIGRTNTSVKWQLMQSRQLLEKVAKETVAALCTKMHSYSSQKSWVKLVFASLCVDLGFLTTLLWPFSNVPINVMFTYGAFLRSGTHYQDFHSNSVQQEESKFLKKLFHESSASVVSLLFQLL